jgi:myo-inositol-1(or 4)-monophosphatase
MKLDIITKQVVNLTKAVGYFIKQEASKFSEKDVEVKGEHNFVTYVDKTAEKMIIKELKKILPEAGFIAEEEQDLRRGDRFNWIVDPLDGTTNFIHSVPLYSISIALTDKDELISGVVYEINLEEAFYAWKGGPAFLNGKEIKVAGTPDIDNSLIATGFPYYDYSLLDSYLELFKDLMKTSRGLRRLGSAAVDLAYVAAGRFEVFYEYGLNPWDVAAGALIVQQAGGKVTDFSNGNNFIFGREIIASNAKVHDEFSLKLNKYFKKKN